MKTNINHRFLMNKNAFFILSIILVCFSFKAQTTKDFSVKNSSNDIERNFMLDLLRAKIKSEFNQNAKFSVNHFLVSGNYGWFTGGVMRSDGSRLVFPKDVDYYDCCHIEALFEKDSKGKWKIAESNAFSTDIWYTCIGIRYPQRIQKFSLQEQWKIIVSDIDPFNSNISNL